MKIKYEFATGEVVEIEVSNNIGEVIVAIEKDTHNSNCRETRKEDSLKNEGGENV